MNALEEMIKAIEGSASPHNPLPADQEARLNLVERAVVMLIKNAIGQPEEPVKQAEGPEPSPEKADMPADGHFERPPI